MCELTHGMAGERYGNGMDAAWARHAMRESAFKVEGVPVYSAKKIVENFKALRISESTTQDFVLQPFGCFNQVL